MIGQKGNRKIGVCQIETQFVGTVAVETGKSRHRICADRDHVNVNGTAVGQTHRGVAADKGEIAGDPEEVGKFDCNRTGNLDKLACIAIHVQCNGRRRGNQNIKGRGGKINNRAVRGGEVEFKAETGHSKGESRNADHGRPADRTINSYPAASRYSLLVGQDKGKIHIGQLQTDGVFGAAIVPGERGKVASTHRQKVDRNSTRVVKGQGVCIIADGKIARGLNETAHHHRRACDRNLLERRGGDHALKGVTYVASGNGCPGIGGAGFVHPYRHRRCAEGNVRADFGEEATAGFKHPAGSADDETKRRVLDSHRKSTGAQIGTGVLSHNIHRRPVSLETEVAAYLNTTAQTRFEAGHRNRLQCGRGGKVGKGVTHIANGYLLISIRDTGVIVAHQHFAC